MRLRACATAAILSVIIILGACSRGNPQETVTLKVATYSAKSFDKEYGIAFQEAHPHIRLAYAELPGGLDSEEAIRGWMNRERPDLVVSGRFLYAALVEAGMALPLDPLARQHDYDLASYPPSLMASLQIAEGDETLYGIASGIHSLALFYNMEIFDRYRLDYPADSMSWRELIRLAASIPGNDGQGNSQYGFVATGNSVPEDRLFQLIEQAGRTEGLLPMNPNTREGTVHTRSWSEIWHAVIDGYRDGAIVLAPIREEEGQPFEGIISTEKYWPFLDGEAAMMLAHSDLLPLLRLDEAMERWGIAAPPGTYQAELQPADIYAINKQSPLQAEAWALLAFANSETTAKARTAVTNNYTGVIPARVAVPEESWKMDLSPFYKQQVIPNGLFLYEALPSEAYAYYREHAIRAVAAILEGRQTVDDALAALNAMLTAELSKP